MIDVEIANQGQTLKIHHFMNNFIKIQFPIYPKENEEDDTNEDKRREREKTKKKIPKKLIKS